MGSGYFQLLCNILGYQPAPAYGAEQTVACQITVGTAPRYTARGAAGCVQIVHRLAICFQDVTDCIDLQTPLRVKQCAGDFHRVVRRLQSA